MLLSIVLDRCGMNIEIFPAAGEIINVSTAIHALDIELTRRLSTGDML